MNDKRIIMSVDGLFHKYASSYRTEATEDMQNRLDEWNRVNAVSKPLQWSKPCETCGGTGVTIYIQDYNAKMCDEDCPDCTDGRQYMDIDDNLRRFTQLARQYVNDPECKAAKQAMINGLEYIESFNVSDDTGDQNE